MKTFSKFGSQGELDVTRVDAVPEGCKPVAAVNGVYIVGHSETGHHHVIREGGVDLMERTEHGMQVFYAILKDPTKSLEHMRGHDTHEPMALGEGIVRISPTVEYDPYAKLVRRTMD